MRIVLAADPWGRELKDAIKAHLIEAGYQVEDLGGTQDHDVNYYDVAPVAARKIQHHEADRAVLCCGTGMGMAIVANKFKGVYASVVESVKTAGLCSAINKANVLTLGGMIMTPPDALQAVDAWLNTAHTQGLEEHKDFLVHALDAVAAVENEACK